MIVVVMGDGNIFFYCDNILLLGHQIQACVITHGFADTALEVLLNSLT